MTMSGNFEEDFDDSEDEDEIEDEFRSRFVKSSFLSRQDIDRIKSKNMIVKFTQYLRPYGTPSEVSTEVSKALEPKVLDLLFAGAKFECEVLTTGDVSFTIELEDDDNEDEVRTLAHEITPNDDSVSKAVETLIKRAHQRLQEINLES